MTLASRLFARLARLRPAEYREVAVERDLAMTTSDGVTLLADRWYPAAQPTGLPVVLLRSPYGRRQLGLIGRTVAERGYQVVIQSCRGTFGSGGKFVPFRNEAADGQATYRWLAEQPWYGGKVGAFGPSYLGLTQWAVAGEPPPDLAAIAPNVTARRFRDIVVFPGGSFTLETGATWLYLLEHQELGLPRLLKSQLRARRGMAPAFTTLPLSGAEEAVLGHQLDFYQDWLIHEQPGDEWWDAVDFAADPRRVPPAMFTGGWYDIFLPAQIDDYVAVRDAGRPARLRIGPWTHASPREGFAALRDDLEWFDEHLRGRPPAGDRAKPVRLWVIGDDRWVSFDAWPPPATPQRWYLHPGGSLRPVPAAAGAEVPDRFRYDPADPTPSVGGPSLNMATAGSKDQAPRERRADVLVYTSDRLAAPLTVAGPLSAELWVRPSSDHVDVHVRLCTVDARGRSRNLSDGILRLRPDGDGGVTHGGAASWGEAERQPDGTVRVRVRMWPTAVTWDAGQRIRLQVAAGAHPLFARNPGGGERLGEATRLIRVDQEVLRDEAHPSGIDLPVSPR